MRVKSGSRPTDILVYPCSTKNPLLREVRIRENIVEIPENGFEYDEYMFRLEDPDGTLETSIQNNLQEWLLTGQTLEISQGASYIYHIEEGHMQDLAALVDMIYEDDLGVIG